MLDRCHSFVLGLLDEVLLPLKIFGPIQPEFFLEGYGDVEKVKNRYRNIMAAMKKPGHLKLSVNQLMFGAVQ